MSYKSFLNVFSVLAFILIIIVLGAGHRQSLALLPKSVDADSISSSKKVHVVDPANQLDMNALKSKLEERLPGIEISDLSLSPLAGFYQIFFSGQLMYVTSDGQYVLTGNLLELAEDAPINHSQVAIAEFEAKKAPERAQTISAIPEADMVVFKAANEKHVISVFTDVDCAYCRKLHKEVPMLNASGVTVRYLAYPRAGIGSDAYKKLVSIWCSDDKMAAMDDAKLKRVFGNKSCKNPVADQLQLTQKLNLSGTPALILDDGELIGGYSPYQELVAHLERKASAKQASISKVSAENL